MVREQVLERIDDPDLLVLTVWMPMLRSDRYERAVRRAALLPDPRVQHFWYGPKKLARAAGERLGLEGRLVWDVYLLYPPGVRWEEEGLPVPSAYWHQFRGLPKERRFDAPALAAEIRGRLGEPR